MFTTEFHAKYLTSKYISRLHILGGVFKNFSEDSVQFQVSSFLFFSGNAVLSKQTMNELCLKLILYLGSYDGWLV
jgi:hypothetical protein